MTRNNLLCLLSPLLLAACSDSGEVGGPDAGPGTQSFAQACPDQACGAATHVTSVVELAGKLTGATWTLFGPYTAGCLTASDDVIVDGTLTMSSADVAVPAFCAQASDCDKRVRFLLRDAPPGVVCLDPEVRFDETFCGGVRLTGTTVRLRPLQFDIHPSQTGNYAPIVELMPACDRRCPEDELDCAPARTCWATPRDYCAYCLGGANEVCACWSETGSAADGTTCSVYQSGDLVTSGRCASGVCVR